MPDRVGYDCEGNDDATDSVFGRRSVLKAAGLVTAGSLLTSMGVSAETSEHPYAIVIDGRGTSTDTTYSFDVTEAVEPLGPTNNTNDTIDGTHVEGTVGDSVNGYWFSGTITRFSVEGPAKVRFGDNTDQFVPGDVHQVVITSPGEISYEFTTTGEARKVIDGSKHSAEKNNDSITENSDGTYTVSGYTGNGHGDSYTFSGKVTEFSPMEGDFSVVLDGSAVSTYDLTGTQPPDNRIVVRSPTEISYEFTSTGVAQKVFDDTKNSAEKNNDSVTKNSDGTHTVSGYTGNSYGDSYDVDGEVTEFSPMEGDFVLEWNGTVVTPYKLTGTEPPKDNGSDGGGGASGNPLIGGGEGYGRTVPASAADHKVSSRGQLYDALNAAGSGDVVYVTGDIDMGDETYIVPNGVTLASNRGINGAKGHRLYTSREDTMFELKSNARVTGLRIEGPHADRGYFDSSYPSGSGLGAEGSAVEIDNCDIAGFEYAGVKAGNDTHIHHCRIHNNSRDGLGYGVVTSGGNPIIEYNYFNYNRHSVASGGSGGFTVRYNHFGPDTIDHVIDMHKPGGDTLIIHHNTIEATHHVQNSGSTEGVYIRGDGPSNVARIENNWFYHSNPPSSGGESGEAIRTWLSSWDAANVELANNAYGTSDPGTDIGCPR